VVAGLVLLTSASGTLASVLLVLLVLTGLDLVVTGAFGTPPSTRGSATPPDP
jgi:hypothetical protein